MTITLPDDVFSSAGISEHDARIELACWLFDAGRLTLWPAAQMANLSQSEFEVELRTRRIPIYRPTLEDVEIDAATLRSMEN